MSSRPRVATWAIAALAVVIACGPSTDRATPAMANGASGPSPAGASVSVEYDPSRSRRDACLVDELTGLPVEHWPAELLDAGFVRCARLDGFPLEHVLPSDAADFDGPVLRETRQSRRRIRMVQAPENATYDLVAVPSLSGRYAQITVTYEGPEAPLPLQVAIGDLCDGGPRTLVEVLGAWAVFAGGDGRSVELGMMVGPINGPINGPITIVVPRIVRAGRSLREARLTVTPIEREPLDGTGRARRGDVLGSAFRRGTGELPEERRRQRRDTLPWRVRHGGSARSRRRHGFLSGRLGMARALVAGGWV